MICWERWHDRDDGSTEVVGRHRYRWVARWLARYNCATKGCYVVDVRDFYEAIAAFTGRKP